MTIKDFNSFLRIFDIYENFYENFSDSLDEEWLYNVLRTAPETVFARSFTWSKTPQGYYFWKFIQEVWKRYISDKDIKKKMTIETFYNFLRKKSSLARFFLNMNAASVKKTSAWLEAEWKCNPEQIINRAFTWSDTPEGNSFWKGIHEEWVDEYEKLQKEESTDIPTYSYKENKVIDCVVKSEETLSTVAINKIKYFIVEKYPQVQDFTITLTSVMGWHYEGKIEKE